MHFHTFVLKNVVRRRVRSSLTVIGMAVAVGAVVALVGISNGTEQTFTNVYKRNNVSILVEQRVKQRLTSVLDARLGDQIREIPGVKDVNPGQVDLTSMEQLGSDGAVVSNGWEPDSFLMKKLDILPGGRLLQAGDTHCVLLGEALADALDKHVGDKLPLYESGEYTVVGIFRSPIMYEARSMVMLLPDLQKVTARKGQVSGFAVMVDHPEDEAGVQQICEKIKALGPRIEARPAAEAVSMTTEIRFIRATSWITSAIAIVIGAVGMLNTMIMSVSERTKEIGILRAIGWRQLRIVRMILVESVLLSLTGGVIGAMGAIGLTRVLGAHPAVAGLIDTTITGEVVFFGIVCSLIVGLLGAAYPAFRGARLLPTEALRHE
jgi:putative ABC transport system permease protein